eukprot:3165101-Ditylum_brightwellii.AAC.1
MDGAFDAGLEAYTELICQADSRDIVTVNSYNALTKHAEEDFTHSNRAYAWALVKDDELTGNYCPICGPWWAGVCQPAG